MKISEKFASNLLKAEDLQGRKVHVVIASVGEEDIGEDHKPVAYFRGKQKGLVLNKTNAAYLANAISDETDEWAGHEIVLYPAKVNFQGKMVDAIRVEMPANGAARASNAHTQASQPVRPVEPRQTAAEELDDEIPF
jgi:hypothetical protein